MGKFTKLYESAIERFTRGGWLTGDQVKFKEGALSDPFFKTQPEDFKTKIKDLMASDLNLVVANIKPKYATTQGAGNTDYAGTDFSVDIVQELMPGKWVNPITVPIHILDRIDTYPSLKDVPKSLKYDNKIKIKPEPTSAKSEENETVQFYMPGTHTHKSDHGGKKNVPGDRTLLNKNTKIPAQEAEKHKDPATYTAMYLPKEKKR